MAIKKRKKVQQLPSQQLLQEIQEFITTRPNHQSETKRCIHYCLFLLCLKVGLRVTEAINFNLELEHPDPEYRGLYLLQGKRQRQRYVYITTEIIEVLKNHN